jgi:hypothetical protein
MRHPGWSVPAIAVIALALAGCGGSQAHPVTRTTSTGAPGEAPRVIAVAAGRLRATRAYTVTFTSHTSVNQQSERETGAFNFVTQQSNQTITVIGGNTPAVQNDRPIKAIASGKLLYLLLPPGQRRSFPRPWLSFTAARYNHVLGRNGGLEAIKSPFFYGASGLRDQFAEYLDDGGPTFSAAGTGTVEGTSARRFRGYTRPITLTLTTRRHKSIRETYQRLGLTVWLNARGQVLRVGVRSVAADDSVITEQFTVIRYGVKQITPPRAADVVSYAAIRAKSSSR